MTQIETQKEEDNINILFNYAHEVGHIKQIAREYNLERYVAKTIIKYIPFGHDVSDWEQEADNGYRVLINFWKYVQRFSRRGNPLESLHYCPKKYCHKVS